MKVNTRISFAIPGLGSDNVVSVARAFSKFASASDFILRTISV